MAEPSGSHEEAPAEPSENPEEASAEAGGPPQEGGVSCKYCPKKFPSLGELGKHMWSPESEGGHREAMLKLQKEGLAEKAKKKAEVKIKELGPPPTREKIYKGEPDAIGILRDILEKHPDIGESVKEEILDWAKLQEFLSPQTLAYLLSQMKGVSSQTANIVAQKYSMALQKAQLEERPGLQMAILPQLQPQQVPFQFPFGGYQPQQLQPQVPQVTYGTQVTRVPPTMAQQPLQQPYTQQPPYPIYQPPPQPQPKGVTREDVDGMVSKTKDEMIGEVGKILKEHREVSEKETLVSVVKAIPKQISEAVSRGKSDEERDTLADVIKNLPAQITEAVAKTKKEEELPKQIAEAVAKAVPKPPPQSETPPPTKEDIAVMVGKAASEAAAKVVEAKTKEDREEKRHTELLSTIRSGVAAPQASGYKEDSYRFLGQGLNALASTLERKEPIKILLEHAPEILRYTAQPGPKELSPEAAGEVMASHPGLKPEWIVQK